MHQKDDFYDPLSYLSLCLSVNRISVQYIAAYVHLRLRQLMVLH